VFQEKPKLFHSQASLSPYERPSDLLITALIYLINE